MYSHIYHFWWFSLFSEDPVCYHIPFSLENFSWALSEWGSTGKKFSSFALPVLARPPPWLWARASCSRLSCRPPCAFPPPSPGRLHVFSITAAWLWCSGSHFLEFVLSCVLWASGSINLCLLLNLGNCQPWFLHSFPSLCISSLPSWDSSCRVPDIIPSFDIIPQVPEALFIFIPNLFLCFSDWMLCLSVLKFTESSVNSKLLLPFIQWIF